jgi:hypothetical protein
MGYVVKYKGLEVSCETPQDVDRLAEHEASGTQRARRQAVARHGSIKRLVKESDQKHKELLGILLNSTDPVSDEDLKTALSLETNKALAGVLAGFSKRSKTAGIADKIIVKSTRRNGTGERHYHYAVNQAAMDEVKQGLDAI